MSHAFFWIPAMMPEAEQQALNRFLQSHRVFAIDRQFVADGERSAWAFCVEYVEGGKNEPPTAARPGKPDYRELLDPETFRLYAALRVRRKELAEAEAMPAYAVATNEQMADMARRRAATLDDLRGVAGFGESRVRKYGTALLEVLVGAVRAESGEKGTEA